HEELPGPDGMMGVKTEQRRGADVIESGDEFGMGETAGGVKAAGAGIDQIGGFETEFGEVRGRGGGMRKQSNEDDVVQRISSVIRRHGNDGVPRREDQERGGGPGERRLARDEEHGEERNGQN